MEVKGSWVAVPTPFKSNQKIDFAGFEEIIDFHVNNDTDGLLILGSAGESSMLSGKEKKKVIEFAVDYCQNKIPVLIGTTGSDTAGSIEMSKFAQNAGAPGVLLVLPPYIKPPQQDIYKFYYDVAVSIEIPLAVYNNPSRVGTNIEAETLIKISRIENVTAIKEAMGDVDQLIRVRKEIDNDIDVLTCDAPVYSIIIPNLAIGGEGVTNISGNLAPRKLAQISRQWQDFDDITRTRKFLFKYFDLMEACYSAVNPIVIKAGMNLYGLPAGIPRKPLQPLSAEKKKQLEQIMIKLDLIEKYKN